MENINWGAFTEDERKGIEKLLEMRMPEHLTSIIINMDRLKEIELQKITARSKPLNDINENQIRERIIENYYKVNPKGPQSPAEEKILQDELDNELAKFHAEQQRKADEQVEILQDVKKDLEKAPFCTQCDSRGVKHKKECPTLLNK